MLNFSIIKPNLIETVDGKTYAVETSSEFLDNCISKKIYSLYFKRIELSIIFLRTLFSKKKDCKLDELKKCLNKVIYSYKTLFN